MEVSVIAQHVVIRREEWVAGSRDRPEVGIFTQVHAGRRPVPWGRISPGERVWMKWTGGPIVASATVQGFRQFEGCSPERLRDSTRGFRLHDLNEYWRALPPRFWALAVYLEDEQWLDRVIVPSARSWSSSWIVLAAPADELAWLSSAPSATERPGASSRGSSRTIRAGLRFEVLRRDGFTCRYCGRRPPDIRLHVDHIIPVAQGGLTEFDNLRAACQDCNLGKGAGPAEATR